MSTAPAPRREVFTEVQLEDGTILAKGDTIHVKGEPDATFVFQHLAVNPSGHQAVSAFGGGPGRGAWRALKPEKVIVQKGRKAIRLAEHGDGLGEPVPGLAEVPEVAAIAKAVKKGKDFDMEVRQPGGRRPQRAAGEGALAAQVADGRVKAGTEINHGEHRAVITADGAFEIAGERFGSPSTAASHALGGRAANGWVWWRLPDGQKLETVR